MARPPLLQCDRTELVLFDLEAKQPQMHNIRYDQITRIQRATARRFRLYRVVTTDVVEIHVGGRTAPFLITRLRAGADFDRFVEELDAFAKRNNITSGRSASR